jgi:hypothetical protein
MTRKPKPPPGVITLDFRPLIEAIRTVFDGISTSVLDLSEMLAGGHERRDKRVRARLGAGNGRAAIWQSDMCAAWLHLDCGATAGLCRCGCHVGRTDRSETGPAKVLRQPNVLT